MPARPYANRGRIHRGRKVKRRLPREVLKDRGASMVTLYGEGRNKGVNLYIAELPDERVRIGLSLPRNREVSFVVELEALHVFLDDAKEVFRKQFCSFPGKCMNPLHGGDGIMDADRKGCAVR